MVGKGRQSRDKRLSERLVQFSLSVDAAALERTSSELEPIYERMQSAGLAAGSVLAKRLFS